MGILDTVMESRVGRQVAKYFNPGVFSASRRGNFKPIEKSMFDPVFAAKAATDSRQQRRHRAFAAAFAEVSREYALPRRARRKIARSLVRRAS